MQQGSKYLFASARPHVVYHRVLRNFALAGIYLMFIVSCSSEPQNATFDATHPEQPHPPSPIAWRVDPNCVSNFARGASRSDCNDPNQTDFIAIGLSGGGTKATVFGGESLFYLQALGLLNRSSLISSVSGGSFAAALYALSCDKEDVRCLNEKPNGASRPVWTHGQIMKTLGQGNRPLVRQQIARLIVPFVPQTISAQTFGQYIDQRFLHAEGPANEPFTFADLNPRRPPLYLNATIVSENRTGLDDASDTCPWNNSDHRDFLRRRTPDEFFHFSFNDQYFRFINSDLQTYRIGDAIAASAAFPALIEPALIRDFCKTEGPSTIRLIDGGANDNQALIELYAAVAELVFGQKRSESWRSADHLIGSHGDKALVIFINSSVTETTGQPGTTPDARPHEIVSFVIDLFNRITAATDTYSAVGFNLRKQLYLRELEQLQSMEAAKRAAGQEFPVYAPVLSFEVSLTELDQYAVGGTEAALRIKSNIDVLSDGSLSSWASQEGTDPAQRIISNRIKRQALAYSQIVERPEVRQQLGLSNWHPQCYFDIRADLDKSLSELKENDQACVREAARWSAALRAQEMCNSNPAVVPKGLNCSRGVVKLRTNGIDQLNEGAERFGTNNNCKMQSYKGAAGKSVILTPQVRSGAAQDSGQWKVQCHDLTAQSD